MPIVGIRELARRASSLLEQVERTGERILVTRHGRAVALIVPLDSEEFEDFVLANAPEFVQAMEEGDRDLAEGRTRPLHEVLAEIDEEVAKRKTRKRRAAT